MPTRRRAGGLSLSSVDLRRASSKEEFVAAVAAAAEKLGPDDWLTGGFWDGARRPRFEAIVFGRGATPRELLARLACWGCGVGYRVAACQAPLAAALTGCLTRPSRLTTRRLSKPNRPLPPQTNPRQPVGRRHAGRLVDRRRLRRAPRAADAHGLPHGARKHRGAAARGRGAGNGRARGRADRPGPGIRGADWDLQVRQGLKQMRSGV